MRVILPLSLAISAVLALSLSLARTFGMSQPLPTLIETLGLYAPEHCSGSSACLLGITPGHSSWDEARTMLLPRARDELYTSQVVVPLDVLPNQTDELFIYFFRSVDGRSVGRIQALFRVREAAPSVGWLVRQHGTPCGISLYTRTASGYRLPQALITMRYPRFLANVPLPKNHLDTSTRIESLYLHDPAYKAERRLEACRDLLTDGVQNRAWAGFAAAWRYAALPRH
ncbi:MAG: hypothetical protein RML95_01985 [Anaerolineae bacterium]|nr:hypothetical protein [Anaerolineae bacterium]